MGDYKNSLIQHQANSSNSRSKISLREVEKTQKYSIMLYSLTIMLLMITRTFASGDDHISSDYVEQTPEECEQATLTLMEELAKRGEWAVFQNMAKSIGIQSSAEMLAEYEKMKEKADVTVPNQYYDAGTKVLIWSESAQRWRRRIKFSSNKPYFFYVVHDNGEHGVEIGCGRNLTSFKKDSQNLIMTYFDKETLAPIKIQAKSERIYIRPFDCKCKNKEFCEEHVEAPLGCVKAPPAEEGIESSPAEWPCNHVGKQEALVRGKSADSLWERNYFISEGAIEKSKCGAHDDCVITSTDRHFSRDRVKIRGMLGLEKFGGRRAGEIESEMAKLNHIIERRIMMKETRDQLQKEMDADLSSNAGPTDSVSDSGSSSDSSSNTDTLKKGDPVVYVGEEDDRENYKLIPDRTYGNVVVLASRGRAYVEWYSFESTSAHDLSVHPKCFVSLTSKKV